MSDAQNRPDTESCSPKEACDQLKSNLQEALEIARTDRSALSEAQKQLLRRAAVLRSRTQ